MLKVRAYLEWRGLFLVDLGSSARVELNGKSVREAVEVRAGDRIKVGDTVISLLSIDSP